MPVNVALTAVSASVLDMDATAATRDDSSVLFISVSSGRRLGLDG